MLAVYRARKVLVFKAAFQATLIASQRKLAMSGSHDHPDVSQIRNPYKLPDEAFTEDNLVSLDPIKQFEQWFKDAAEHSLEDVNALTLATVGAGGRPSARIVLLKGYGPDGFKFFTNHCSRKGKELAANPYVALVFFWGFQHRSIRIEGKAERISEEESVRYFETRPKPSQIAAHVSTEQSSPIPNRDYITKLDEELRAKYDGKEVPKPEYWGGYLVRPDSFEFWQGQTTRMHDRIKFHKGIPDDEMNSPYLKKGENGWFYERLMP